MSLRDLAAIYLVLGVACAVAIYRTSPERGVSALASAALAVPLWPLWGPVVLTSTKRPPAPALSALSPSSPVAGAAARIEAALREGVAVCAGTSLEALLPRDAADRISAEVHRAARRHDELSALLGREGFDRAAAEARLAELTRAEASARALSTARLHLDNVRRLGAMRDRDARALDELADLMQALRAQLVVAQFEGAQAEGAGGIVSEMWARVEGLGVALGDDDWQLAGG
jgi:hypothetical protein